MLNCNVYKEIHKTRKNKRVFYGAGKVILNQQVYDQQTKSKSKCS